MAMAYNKMQHQTAAIGTTCWILPNLSLDGYILRAQTATDCYWCWPARQWRWYRHGAHRVLHIGTEYIGQATAIGDVAISTKGV